MKRHSSITVIIPAFNEEKYLESTLRVVTDSVKSNFKDYEILVFNDGSADRTGEIADDLAKQLENITVIHHKEPICLGSVFKKGLSVATKEYLIRINGKNDITRDNLDRIFSMCGEADLIIPYQINANERALFRRVASKCFTNILNTLTGLNLRYYNHYVLHRKEILNNISICTDSYAFQAEVLIKLIKSGHSYIEVGVTDNFDNDVKTRAFCLENLLGVSRFLFNVIKYVRIL